MFKNGYQVAQFLHPAEQVSWVWETAVEPAGTYLLQAVAYDRAGNLGSVGLSLTLVPAEQGEFWLEYRSVDRVGNMEPLRTERIGIDLTPPDVEHEIEGTPGSNGWWLQAELHLFAMDDKSGVDELLYRFDGGPWESYAGPVGLPEGVHFVEYTATDRAGNQAAVANVSVKVDSMPPHLAILRPAQGEVYLGNQSMGSLGSGPALIVATSPAGGVGGVEFTAVLQSEDETSGVDRLVLWLNQERLEVFLRPGPEVSWVWNTTSHPAGTYLLHAVASDFAGNVATTTTPLTLMHANEHGLKQTITQGPSLYPLLDGGWPLSPP